MTDNWIRRSLACLFVFTLTFAASALAEEALSDQLPATYMGTLPCADCPGVDHHLNLTPDHAFALRTTYRDRAGTFDDIGTWSLGSDDTTLVLSGGREAPLFFSIVDDSTLRQLDIEGREIDSDIDHELKRQKNFVPFEPRLHMSGMFRYMADAALFEECLTGRSMPVAQEGDYLALERAYLEARSEPGAPLLVNLEGALAMRPPMEGEGVKTTLVVERFVGVQSGEECPPRPGAAPLVGPRWEVVRLGDEAVVNPEGRETVHIEFDDELSRVYGFTGCNRFHGGFELDGDKLAFGPTAMTMMACLDEMETEQKLAAAMDGTVSWKILGASLELYDGDGALLARLRATDPR